MILFFLLKLVEFHFPFYKNKLKLISVWYGDLSLLEKGYIEYTIISDKKSIEEVMVQRVVKTTLQTFNDKGLFDKYNNAVKL